MTRGSLMWSGPKTGGFDTVCGLREYRRNELARLWRTRSCLPVGQRGLVTGLSVVPRAHMAMGKRARERVQERVLTIQLLEQCLDLTVSFETAYRLP